jgi:hypothetical protein
MQLLTSNIVYSKKQIKQMEKILLSLLFISSVGVVFAQKEKKKEKVVTVTTDVNSEDAKGRKKDNVVTVTTDVSDSDIKGKKKIKIVKNVNGKMEVIEKIVDGDSLDDNPMVIMDEAGEGSNTRIIIKVDSTGEQVWEGNKGSRNKKGVRVYKFDGREFGQDMGREFDLQMDNLSRSMRDLPRTFRNSKPFIYDDNEFRVLPNKGIRNLDVYTNQPESNIINVRFFAPTEGDVKISVIDLDGKVISKTEEKAFKGEYMDQVRLPKDTKGIFFVIVSQGDDGVSRKVKVGNMAPEDVEEKK